MSRTITALFDTRADADAGGERLRQAGIDASNVNVHDNTTHKTSGDYSTRKDQGMWASIKNVFVPDEDRHAYDEGVRRGGFLLTAEVDEDKTPLAVKALEEANSIDLDARTAQWRSDGWDYATSDEGFGEVDETSAIPFGRRDSTYGSDRFRTYVRDDER